MRSRRANPLFGAAVLAACSSGPEPPARPETEKLVVHLLDGDFVRFSERRISVDEFVYELRVRCRAVGGDPDRLPWLEIRVPRDGSVTPAPRVLETIRTRAFEIGVLRIEMIYEDAR